jgi:hypothetical protein
MYHRRVANFVPKSKGKSRAEVRVTGAGEKATLLYYIQAIVAGAGAGHCGPSTHPALREIFGAQ